MTFLLKKDGECDVFAEEGRGVSIMWILCRETFLLEKDGECL